MRHAVGLITNACISLASANAGMSRLLLTASLVASAAAGAVELTPDNFDKEVLQSGKAAFIKFQAPW